MKYNKKSLYDGKIEVKLYESDKKTKKYTIIFYDDGKEIKSVDFGARNMSDFTIHKDEERKERFLKRFEKKIEENKNNSFSPMTLSHLILWNKPTLSASFNDFKKKFNLF